jgi:8-amino-7-oxononanoate synthase
MPPLEKIADKYISELQEKSLFRELKDTQRRDGIYVSRGGKQLISFSCNDYLGLSHHPKVKQAAIDAIEKYGAGSGASRFVTGNNPLYNELESRLARLKNTEDAIVFGSGYLANIGIIPALVGKGDLIIADKLVHACLIDGAMLSGAKLMRFAHNNMQKCEELLQKHRHEFTNCLILTDHVFSMDGDVAPIGQLLELAGKYDAGLLSDDAHGLGVLESGIKNLESRKPDSNYLQMGTLSKAVGSYGGYVCTSKKIADYLRNKCRSLIYSTALPPSVLASAIAALEIIENDAELVRRAGENARYFVSKLQVASCKLQESQSSIVALILGSAEAAIKASKILEDEGFLVSAIRPPTVPPGTARLRFTFSALHKREDIEKLAKVVTEKILHD